MQRTIPDRQLEEGKRYPLASLLLIAIAAMPTRRWDQLGIGHWGRHPSVLTLAQAPDTIDPATQHDGQDDEKMETSGRFVVARDDATPVPQCLFEILDRRCLRLFLAGSNRT